MLGWNPGTEEEILNMDELIDQFVLEKIQKGGAVFSEEKLNWYNHQYIKNISDEKYLENVLPYFEKYQATEENILPLKKLVLERINVFDDLKNMIGEGEFDYFFNDPVISQEKVSEIIWKKSDKEKTIVHLKISYDKINSLNEKIDEEEVKNLIWEYAEQNGKGDVLWPLRYSLSGVNKSPDPFAIISIIGKTRTLKRITNALELLKC